MTQTSDSSDEETIEVEFEPAPKKRRWKTILTLCTLAALLITCLTGIAWIALQPYINTNSPTAELPTPTVQPSPDPEHNHSEILERLKQIENTLDSFASLTQRTSRLETTFARTRSALTTRGQALSDLNQRLKLLDAKLERLETRTNTIQTDTTPNPVPPEPNPASQLSTKPPTTDSDKALRVGLAALEAALKTNAPFDETYGIVTELAPDDEYIKNLKPIARLGAPLWSELKIQLLQYRNSQIERMQAEKQKNRSLWQKILDSFVAFDTNTNTTDQQLDLAADALASGDFEKLQTALANHAQHPDVASLLEQARRRTLADRAAASIRTHIRALGDNQTESDRYPD